MSLQVRRAPHLKRSLTPNLCFLALGMLACMTARRVGLAFDEVVETGEEEHNRNLPGLDLRMKSDLRGADVQGRGLFHIHTQIHHSRQ